MEGDLLASYGQEDLCWTNNAAGNPEFTEYMYNNPDDLSLAEAYHYYAKLGGAAVHITGIVNSPVCLRAIWML